MMKDLSMHVLDIIQNSTVAGAKNVILEVDENPEQNLLSFTIIDDGKGMSKDFIQLVRNPFTTTRTTRKVGLGIPFLSQTCETCGGSLEIESEPGKGTTIRATMAYDHIDRPPMGDLEETIYTQMITESQVDFVYRHLYNGKKFEIATKEIKAILGEDVPLTTPDVLAWIKESIHEGLLEIKQN